MFNVGSTCSTLSPSQGTRTGHTAGVNTVAISTGVISNIILAKCLYTLLYYRLCLNVVKYIQITTGHVPSISTAGFSGWCPAQSEVPRTCTCSPLLSSASNCLKFGSRKLENVPPPNIEIVCCLPSFDKRARPMGAAAWQSGRITQEAPC